MIRSLPGSVKDIKTLYHSINELGIEGKILILDRGFFPEGAT
jgi:RNA 3'-terminal phosphate cyclase